MPQAIALLAYDSLCRRSELTSLKVENIDKEKLRIRLCRSKTDQDSIGRWIQIASFTNQSLQDWLNCAHIQDGYIFRGIANNGEIANSISPAQINRIFKKIAKAANLSDHQIKSISGHSLRVGAAQDLLLAGASLPMIMSRGRWTKPDTTMRYIEQSDLLTS